MTARDNERERAAFEAWAPVPGFPGYEASNFGRVRSVPRTIEVKRAGGKYLRPLSGALLATQRGPKGYLHLALRASGKGRTFAVHQIIGMTFLGARPVGHEIAHWDGNKENNRVENLRYATSKENKQDAARLGAILRGESRTDTFFTSEQVALMKLQHADMNAGEIARYHSAKLATVHSILQGKRWAHINPTPSGIRPNDGGEGA